MLVRGGVLLGGAALILVVMLGLGWLVTHAEPSAGPDLAIAAWLAQHRTPALDAASTVATDVCSTTSVFVLGFLAAACSAGLLRRWWPAVLLAIALVGELWLFLATAMITKRPRPPVAHVDAALPPTSSFPSGHTGAAVCLFGGSPRSWCAPCGRGGAGWWSPLPPCSSWRSPSPGCTGARTTSPMRSARSCWR